VNTCNAEHQQLVDDCANRAHRLTQWEAYFIASCKERLVNGRALTDNQAARLNEVWDRVTDKG
jgi:hypothetical protein